MKEYHAHDYEVKQFIMTSNAGKKPKIWKPNKMIFSDPTTLKKNPPVPRLS